MEQQMANFSNHIWQIDTVALDMDLSLLEGRAVLTVVQDVYSQCIAGYRFGAEKPNASVFAALLQAVRPKTYLTDNDLAGEWTIYGSPQFLMVDRSLSHDSEFTNALRRVPETSQISLLHPSSSVSASAIGSLERLMNHVNMQMLKFHPMPSVANRSSSSEQATGLPKKDIERFLVKYFVDEYNQGIHPRDGHKTRLQKWEFGRPSSSESSLKRSDEA